MTAAITVPAGAGLCHLPSPFRLHRGGELRAACLAYERQGPRDAPVVVVLGGISAHRHVAASPAVPQPGWWRGVVGAGFGIDTERVQVLSFDWLGGVGGSSAPGAGEAFPFVDARDQARALWALCDVLRIDEVAAIVGASYGGMVAMHAAAERPDRCQRLVAIAAAHRSHPQASAWRRVQRAIVEHGRDRAAVALARQLAMTTYRSPGELAARFGGGVDDRDLARWLTARGERFAADWNAEQFLCLNRSIDGHVIEPARLAVPTYLLAFDSDLLVPAGTVRELARGVPHLLRYGELSTPFGHDAFLKETAAVGAFVQEALR